MKHDQYIFTVNSHHLRLNRSIPLFDDFVSLLIFPICPIYPIFAAVIIDCSSVLRLAVLQILLIFFILWTQNNIFLYYLFNHEVHNVSLVTFRFWLHFLIEPCFGDFWRFVQIFTAERHCGYYFFWLKEPNKSFKFAITGMFRVLDAKNGDFISKIRLWSLFFPSARTYGKNFTKCFSKLMHIVNNELKKDFFYKQWIIYHFYIVDFIIEVPDKIYFPMLEHERMRPLRILLTHL